MTNQKLLLNRTVGLELEGHARNISNMNKIKYADVGGDGSLRGGDGVEVRTIPLSDLNKLQPIFKVLGKHSFHKGTDAGLHVHVDISDFTVEQKVNLIRFSISIEHLMYVINDSYRSGNSYCEKLHKDWRKVYRKSYFKRPIPFDQFRTLAHFIDYARNNANRTGGSNSNRPLWNGRYQWLNAQTRYGTVEFRIFEAVDEIEQATKFAMLAYHIVETVKHSTLKQLMFIKKTVYAQKSVDEMLVKLCEGIGLDPEFKPSIHNSQLATTIDNKFCKPNREAEEKALAEAQAEAEAMEVVAEAI